MTPASFAAISVVLVVLAVAAIVDAAREGRR
jgi:hypothetical protein